MAPAFLSPAQGIPSPVEALDEKTGAPSWKGACFHLMPPSCAADLSRQGSMVTVMALEAKFQVGLGDRMKAKQSFTPMNAEFNGP